MWEGFSDVRKLAIRELSPQMDPISKIMYARQYEISNWLLAGYKELAKRPRAINLAESKLLGLYATCGIFRIREASRKTKGPYNYTVAMQAELEEELKAHGA